jgi:hypothetical protein
MRSADTNTAVVTEGNKHHESFMAYSRFLYLKIALALAVASVVLYAIDRPYGSGSGYGGSWAGYTLGTIGALLILWLTWFGYHKRSYANIRARLASQLSAHVYLGLALLVVATLHTGFHFGWNVHTLAYILMCVVIASGVFGIFCYARYPRLMTDNRAGMTMQQMLGRIASLDDELRLAALPLDHATAMVIARSTETNVIGGSVWRQLSGRLRGCTTEAAIAYLYAKGMELPAEIEDAWRRVRVLLEEKGLLLTRVRRDISYKAMMDVWLYLHVPIAMMLLVALFAHVFSVFFLW